MLNQSLNTLSRLAKESKAYVASAYSFTYAAITSIANIAITLASAVPATLGIQLQKFADKIKDNSVNSQDLRDLIEAVSQDNGKVAKEFINLVASDQLKNSIVNNVDDQNLKALVDAVLQDNGKVAKDFVNLIASDQLKNSIVKSIEDQNPKALVETVLQNNGEVANKFIDFVVTLESKDSITK